MGCDSWWTSACADPEEQQHAVTMFRELFDVPGLWPRVDPDPARRRVTLFAKDAIVDAVRVESARDRVEPAYPANFFGVASHLLLNETSNLMRRGQLVFDRSAGGRIVSLIRVGDLADSRALARDPTETVVVPGGCVRLMGERQCPAFAIFLRLLRMRHCPTLAARDDRGCLEFVARRFDGKGLSDAARARIGPFSVTSPHFAEKIRRKDGSLGVDVGSRIAFFGAWNGLMSLESRIGEDLGASRN